MKYACCGDFIVADSRDSIAGPVRNHVRAGGRIMKGDRDDQESTETDRKAAVQGRDHQAQAAIWKEAAIMTMAYSMHFSSGVTGKHGRPISKSWLKWVHAHLMRCKAKITTRGKHSPHRGTGRRNRLSCRSWR